jgi:hypothetical protein
MKVELQGLSWPRWPKPRLTKGPGRRMLLAGSEGWCEGRCEVPAFAGGEYPAIHAVLLANT